MQGRLLAALRASDAADGAPKRHNAPPRAPGAEQPFRFLSSRISSSLLEQLAASQAQAGPALSLHALHRLALLVQHRSESRMGLMSRLVRLTERQLDADATAAAAEHGADHSDTTPAAPSLEVCALYDEFLRFYASLHLLPQTFAVPELMRVRRVPTRM